MTAASLEASGSTPVPRARFVPRLHGLWSLAGFAIVLATWQGAVTFGHYPEVILPSPLAVAIDMVRQRGLLAQHSLITLREILTGFGLSVLIGTVAAFAIAFSTILARLLMPVLVVTNAIPKVAVAPIILIWFGFGQTTNVLLAVLVAIFPIVINTTLGLTLIDPDLVRLGRIMGGSGPRILWYIRLPAALPNVFAGLKLGITLATIGTIVGEMIAGQEGIGYLSQYAAGQLLTVMAFSCIVAMSMLGVALFYAVVLMERLAVGPARARVS